MQEFYIEDKEKHVIFRGIAPHNDINIRPLDYAIYPHTKLCADTYIDLLKSDGLNVSCFDEQIIRQKALMGTIDLVKGKIKPAPQALSDLLEYDLLSKRRQKKLLQNLKLTPDDIFNFLLEADSQGFLLDVYKFEVCPPKYYDKKQPKLFVERDDGKVETIGDTEMSEGEMKAMIHDRKVVVARIFHKGEHWHCFYHTARGMLGQEPGEKGCKPHWHYISDKFGISREDLQKRMESCDMPSSDVHILVERDEYGA